MRAPVWWAALWLPALAVAPTATVIFDYAAREVDELEVRRGDAVDVLGMADGEDDWLVARRRTDGASGLLPLNYVRLHSAEPMSGRNGGTASPVVSATPHALAEAVAAARRESEDDDGGGGGDDAALRAAVRAYRRRRALYNGPAALNGRWGVQLDLESSADPQAKAAEAVLGPEPAEHRSGVGGVPFFNLAEYVDEQLLASEIVRMLRDEWLPAGACEESILPGLDDALRRAAGPFGRDVVLTFANLGATSATSPGSYQPWLLPAPAPTSPGSYQPWLLPALAPHPAVRSQ